MERIVEGPDLSKREKKEMRGGRKRKRMRERGEIISHEEIRELEKQER